MKLSCSSCSATIAGADIDLTRGVGVCRSCGELVPLPAAQALVAAKEQSALLYRPSDIRWRESEDGETTTIFVRRKRAQAFFTVPFLVFWFGFLAVWYAAAIHSGNLLMLVFPLLHVGAGLFVAWNTARLFNTTYITIGPAELTVREGPVPVPRSARVFPEDFVRGFEVTQRPVGRGGVAHRVSILTADGIKTLLPMSFDDGAHAIYASARLGELIEEARTRRLQAHAAAYRD